MVCRPALADGPWNRDTYGGAEGLRRVGSAALAG